MKKRKKKSGKLGRIGIADYMKAIKKANREAELENSQGWKATSKAHKSKKTYNRKKDKKNLKSEE